MKMLVLFPIFCFLLPTQVSRGEFFQLHDSEGYEKADERRAHSAEDLLEIQEGKLFVINFLEMSAKEKYKATTKQFKEIVKTSEFFRRLAVPEEGSFEKIDFLRVDLYKKNEQIGMTLKANIYWFSEGYDGLFTSYFELKKEGGKWLLDWVIY